MTNKFIKIKDSIVGIFKGLVGLALFAWVGYLFCTSDYGSLGPGGPICNSYSSDEEDEEAKDRSMIEYLESKGYIITESPALL